MSAATYRNNISRYFNELVRILQVHNSLNRTDQALDTEDLFCKLLNQAFGWNLVNANRKNKNQDSFDLEDASAGRILYIQVTSNKGHTDKKKSALKSFSRRATSPTKSRFIILFIADNVSTAVLNKQDFTLFTYEGWDLQKLLGNILTENTTAIELESIYAILHAEMSAKIIIDPDVIQKDFLPLPKPVSQPNGQLKIKRTELLLKAFTFAKEGNGLIVGGPGEGKTFLVRELQRKYLSHRIPCYIIPVENLTTAFDDNIRDELGGNGNWLKALSKMPRNQDIPNLLIFDAFDTAKDPVLKNTVLQQIRKAIAKLTPSWNILVSARHYEATKSPSLLDLFPEDNIQSPIRSRHLEIPLLEIREVRTSLRKKHLLSAFEKSTEQLQQLLRVPYFLQLFGQLVNSAAKNSRKQIEVIETEEQLLNTFWNKMVTPDSASVLFIDKIAHHLSDQLKHTFPRYQLVNETHNTILDHLIGNGILSSSSITGQTISFSHNILLDYAISLYVIPQEPPNLTGYLQQNERHWLLFRPSYIYFYSRLWRTDRDLFWRHYHHLTSIDSPIHRLFRQTILNFVLGSLYKSPEEIEAAFATLSEAERMRSYWKFLEVLRYLNKSEVPVKEYYLLSHLSQKHLDDHIVWELGFHISRAIEQASKFDNSLFLRLMSDAAVNYMQFFLKQRKDPLSKNQMDGNAGNWAVNNLCKTFQYNKIHSKQLLLEFLTILKEPGFPIRTFYHLTEHLTVLSQQDVRLAKRIFCTLYNHHENSNEPTLVGNDVNITLSSTRSQDFQGVHYALERLFPSLIRQAPEDWIPMGIDIVNDHNLGNVYYSKHQKAFPFTIGNIKARMMPDFIHYDQHYDKENGPVSFITKIFEYLNQIAGNKQRFSLGKQIELSFATAQAGSLWTEMIRFIVKFPQKLKREALKVLTCPTLLSSITTMPTAGDLISALWPELTSKQQAKVRLVISSMQQNKIMGSREVGYIQKSLLSRIPAFESGSGEATMAQTSADLENNRPSAGSPLRNRDPESFRKPAIPLPPAVAEGIALLRAFNNKYDANAEPAPQPGEYASLVTEATALFAYRMTEPVPPAENIVDCDDELCRYCRIVSKQAKDLSAEMRQYIELIASHFLYVREYITLSYQTGPLSGGVQGYSPTPRMEAAKTLLNLLNSDTAGDIRQRILDLFQDNNHNIRFFVLQSLGNYWHNDKEKFWVIVSGRLSTEENPLCLQALLNMITYDDIIQSNMSEVERLAREAARILGRSEERLSDLFQTYACLMIRLYNTFNSKEAGHLIYNNLSNKNLTDPLSFILISLLDPHVAENSYELTPDINQRAFELLTGTIEYQFTKLQGKTVSQLSSDDLHSIDKIISQMYYTFVLGKREYKDVVIGQSRKAALYQRFKPILVLIVTGSGKIDKGFMVAHSGYHFVLLLNYFLPFDPSYILDLLKSTVKYSAANGFTYGQTALQEISKITETIFTDHGEILADSTNFNNLLIILDLFAQSGWVEALELTWRIKDAF